MPIKELKVEFQPGLKKLDIYSRRDVLSRTLEGEWSTVFKGKGIEFAGFRNYVYGDDASLIDWKASLRSKETMVREFEDFKNFTVFFLLDVSDSMLFSSGDKLKCEYGAELIYVLADAVNKAGDSVGLAMFNDGFVNSIYPNIGREIIKNMETNLKNGKNYGGKFDLPKTLLMTRSFIKSKAVIIIVSDFLGMQKGWERYVQLMADEYEVIAIMVKDPRDRELPNMPGQFLLQNPYTNENIYVDLKQYGKRYKELSLEHERLVSSVFKKSRGDFVLIPTDNEYVPLLIDFFRRRSRRQD